MMKSSLCKFAVAFLDCWLIDSFILNPFFERYESRKKDKSSSYSLFKNEN